MQGKRVLVTGGAGFLGYHLAQNLPSRGVAFLACNDIAPFFKDEYPAGVLLANVDVRDREAMTCLIRDHRIDLIIHCAAALPLWKRAEIYSTNVEGVRTTLDVAHKLGVERVVFISSTAVYGVPDKHPLEETDPVQGVGAYGETKIIGESICAKYRALGMCAPVIRPKTFIGAARLGVFQILYDWVDSGKRIPIIGRGLNRYQLLEVRDLIDAICLAATLPREIVNAVFNVGATRFEQVRVDVGALCDFADTGAKVLPTPAAIVKPALAFFELIGVSPLYKWVYGTADKDSFVSTTKAETQLGWKANYSNQDALIASHKWYLEHKDELSHARPGVTHRVGWDQGALKFFKRWL